jgi:hypothetical protein
MDGQVAGMRRGTILQDRFGFKLHPLVDVRHEVVLGYEATDTKAGLGGPPSVHP